MAEDARTTTAEVGHLTDAQLAEMSAREQAASDGPWKAGGIGDFGFHVIGPAGGVECDDSEQGRLDATFIAAARTDVPALIAEVRRLQERLKAAEDVCVLFSWTPAVDSERGKAAYMLWRRWLEIVGDDFVRRENQPHLGDYGRPRARRRTGPHPPRHTPPHLRR